jgi:galactonate dehydratase
VTLLKIADIKTYVVSPKHRNYIYVEVVTDEGITGIGEAYSVGPDLATVETINYFKDWLVGEDPANIEYLWAKMYNFTRFPGGSIINAAISGIELALWDIAGKAAGLPVYKLVGGKTRDKIWVYGRPAHGTGQQVVEHSLKLKEKYGYNAIKTDVLPDKAESLPFGEVLRYADAKMRTLRDGLGDDMEIAVDIHARVFDPHSASALQLIEVLQPYRPYFVEEPLRPENIREMGKLKQKTSVTLANGECLYTKHEFTELLRCDAADILQPDMFLTGGFLEIRKIAALAEAAYKPVAPHNPLSPLATAIYLHFCACAPNFLILEHFLDDTPERKDLINEHCVVQDGYISLPNKPGWGVELNKDMLEKHHYNPWRRNFNKHADGSFAFV